MLNKGLVIANEKTDYDIDLGRIYLSPFHHSPLAFYRAYKGKTDLPLSVEIDSVFVGHRGQDTLLYAHALRLHAIAKTSYSVAVLQRSGPIGAVGLTSIPIEVNTLRLESATFHSDSLIAAVGVDAVVNRLEVSSPQIIIAEGKYPVHGLRLNDVDVAIDLRPTSPDTTAQDTTAQNTPLRMAFDAPDAEIRNVHFRLTPLGMDIRVGSIAANALADVGANLYEARRIDIGGVRFALNQLRIPVDTVYGNARVNLAQNSIISQGLHVRSDEMSAKVDLSTTEMDLATMRIDVTGDAEYQGSKVRIRAAYDIDDEAYDAHVNVACVNLTPFVPDLPPLSLAGSIEAKGKGINLKRPMRSQVSVRLDDVRYDSINVSGLDLDAALVNKDLDATLQMRDIRAHVAGEDLKADRLQLDFATDTATSLDLTTQSLNLSAHSPMHVMQLVDKIQPLLNVVSDSAKIHALTSLEDLTVLDTIRRRIPEMDIDLRLRHGSPAQPFIERFGLDIRQIDLVFASDAQKTDLSLTASMPNIYHPEDSTALRLPAVDASLGVQMEEGKTMVSLLANTELTDGAMNVHDLCSNTELRMDLVREGRDLYGNGQLKLDSVSFGEKELGSHAIDLQIEPSSLYSNALRADVYLDYDVPLDLVNTFVTLKDIDLDGAIRASASLDGLPSKPDISAEVQPLGVSAMYTPYQAGISLGNTPIVMNHNHVDLNGLPIYGADSSFIALSGGLDLDSMFVDVRIEADSFAPVKLPQGGPIPVYGDLALDIQGRVKGPLDNIVADVDVTILPTTDITYPIDKKNLAQVKPHGTVNVRYGTADGELRLGGRINVDDGFVKYSPKAYPIMPFHVDSGSHVAFHGPIGKTELNVSASQKVKADVESEGEDTRRVDFTTGVRVKGELDSIGIRSIGFFLEAPDDEAVTQELETVDEDTREGLAATLLATGMYVGESNVAAKRDGYALSSIVNSRINAAMSNSKVGKFIDIDFSSGQSSHASGTTNDMNISISKSFFKDKLRLTVGSTITDNPEINNASGLFNNFTADYKLTKEGDVALRLYSQRDYNNVLEGELYKSGLSVLASKDWKRKQTYLGDSINRTYGVAYRSNNSLGPDVTIKSTVKNLFGKGEQFILKGNGAYYWALRNRHPGDPKKTDTYKLGANASLIFPYLHWVGDDNPKGDTRYILGYQYENIAGGYGVHKMFGSFTYFIQSPNSPYVTHAFTPFSLSVVLMKAENDSSLIDKASEFPELIKVIAGNEFVPSIRYDFIYDNYRSKRAVNTYLNLGIKESGNLINSLYCLFGSKWNDKEKPLGSITYNQFVKLIVELRNRFNFPEQVSIATRLYAGTNIPLGNSYFAPLSEAFYTGGPNSLRAAAPYAYGPGNFYSTKYNQNFFHAGDIKLEANFELRFPIVWKLFGAAFVDAGNVWNWYSIVDLYKAAGIDIATLEIPDLVNLHDGFLNNPDLSKQIALGTGAGLRLDLDGLVVRLDFGIGIHAPYQTYRYNKEGKLSTPTITCLPSLMASASTSVSAIRSNSTKKRDALYVSWVESGARTHDTRNHNPMLCQLSYDHHVHFLLLKSGCKGTAFF